MARLKGLEPLTHCLEGSCSIHLSYKRIGAGDGTRTHNTWNHNPVLCQLNYTHHIDAEYCADHHSLRELVRQKGLEPLAHCLEGSCSIHLSYRRIWSG